MGDMTLMLSALVICGGLSPIAADIRPKGLNKKVVLDQLVGNLAWRELPDTPLVVAGEVIRVDDTGSKVTVFDGDRRVATLRKLPGTVSLARKHEARSYRYLIAIRRRLPSGALEVASCTGIPLQSRAGTSHVVDADLDGNFLEPDEDTLLLYDASLPVTFEGDVWHLDKRWDLSAGVLHASDHSEPDGWDGLLLLNHCRQLAGLKSVRHDELRSERAALHANYVVQNWGTTFNHHTEDPLNEWYTEGGALAAKTSLFGYPPSGAARPRGLAVRSNLDIVYHRRSLLDPNLSELGFGKRAGQGSLSYDLVCIDVGGRARGLWVEPVVWPADGQYEVPVRFNGLEQPMPLPSDVTPSNRGYPVTLIFRYFQPIVSSKLNLFLIDPKGIRHEVEGYCFGPGREIPDDGSTYAYAYKSNAYTCHFIAKSPLVKERWYEAVGHWVEGGKEHERRWTFRTGRMADTPLH